VTSYEELIHLLEECRLDDESSKESPEKKIDELITREGWEVVRSSVFRILSDKSLSDLWHEAAVVLWGAVLHKMALDANFTIALLYRCLQQNPEIEENLVWSITNKLKHVGYLSRYDPLKDPEVIRHMQKLNDRL
jgi:hypothetical protein